MRHGTMEGRWLPIGAAMLLLVGCSSSGGETNGGGTTGGDATGGTTGGATGATTTTGTGSDTTGGETGTGEDGGSAVDCAAAQAAAQAAVAEALAGPQPCLKHADCALVDTSTACGGTCGAVVNQDSKAAVLAAVAAASADICEAVKFGDHCDVDILECAAANPGCHDGQCVYDLPAGCADGTFTPYGTEECVDATCANMGEALDAAIDSAIDAAPACVADAECVIVSTDTPCRGTCGAAVHSAASDDVGAAVAWATEHLCDAHDYAGQCGYATPDCMAPKPGCVDGVCVYAKPTGECPGGMFTPYDSDDCLEATCENLGAAKEEAISAAVAAGKTCTEDAQCVMVDTSTACSGTCGAAVNQSATMAVGYVVGWVDEHLCEAHDYAGQCGYSTPSCSAPDPGCVDGLCVYAKPEVDCTKDEFEPYQGEGCVDATCVNMSQAKNDAIAQAVAVGSFCSDDAECVVVSTSTACAGTCGAAVNSDAAESVGQVVDWVDTNLCEAHDFAAQCGYSTPKCVAPDPGCVDGHCVYAKPPPPGCPEGTFLPYESEDCVEATCQNMGTAVWGAVEDALDGATSCTASSQCIIVPTSTACGGTCGAAINAASADMVAEVIGWVDDNICLPNDYGMQCGYATPDCIAPNPGCVEGLCVYAVPITPECAPGSFHPYGSNECLEANCSNFGQAKQEALDAAIDAANDCSTDSECVIASSGTACNGTCGAAVNSAHKASFEAEVDAISAAICVANDVPLKCGYFTPSCIQPDPACVDGECAYFK